MNRAIDNSGTPASPHRGARHRLWVRLCHACGMNGRELPLGHGAPLRARVETQLGYKSLKFLRRIEVTDVFDDNGSQGNIQNGWSWYAGI